MARRAHGVHVRDRQFPPDHFADLLDHRLWRRHGGVVAHHRNAEGVAVEPAGMRALHGLVQPAVTALEGLAVLVDQHVVANVAPAEVLGVVGVDAAHDARRLFFGVVIRSGGVVDGRRDHAIVVVRVAAPHPFVGAPALARNDVGHRRIGDIPIRARLGADRRIRAGGSVQVGAQQHCVHGGGFAVGDRSDLAVVFNNRLAGGCALWLVALWLVDVSEAFAVARTPGEGVGNGTAKILCICRVRGCRCSDIRCPAVRRTSVRCPAVGRAALRCWSRRGGGHRIGCVTNRGLLDIDAGQRDLHRGRLQAEVDRFGAVALGNLVGIEIVVHRIRGEPFTP